MSEVTRVQGYRTTDGKLWDIFNEAIEHQARLDIKALVDRHGGYSDTQDAINYFINENGKELYECLKELYGGEED